MCGSAKRLGSNRSSPWAGIPIINPWPRVLPMRHPTPVQAMAHRLQTSEGKKLYAKRKHTPEPVFGIIKSVLGFRQFLMRGLEKVKAEWTLVTLAWNMKRMFALKAA